MNGLDWQPDNSRHLDRIVEQVLVENEDTQADDDSAKDDPDEMKPTQHFCTKLTLEEISSIHKKLFVIASMFFFNLRLQYLVSSRTGHGVFFFHSTTYVFPASFLLKVMEEGDIHRQRQRRRHAATTTPSSSPTQQLRCKHNTRRCTAATAATPGAGSKRPNSSSPPPAQNFAKNSKF